MSAIRRIVLPGLMVATTLATLGCVERKERITVHPDGRVSVQVTHRADSSNELAPGYAPAESAGWARELTTELDSEGRTKHVLHARKEFPGGLALPSTYAPPGDPMSELHLKFPTVLSFEDREDGRYYHVRRVYISRPWAYIDATQEKLRGQYEDVLDRDPADLNHDERIRLIRLFAESTVHKMAVFANLALKDVTGDVSQLTWLRLRSAILGAADALDYDRLAKMIVAADANDERLKSEAESFDEVIWDRIRQSLRRAAAFDEAQIDAFVEAYRWHERFHEITNNLGGHNFTIEIEMPGEIVGHNADSIEDGVAVWKFGGGDLRDRDLELMVSSRIES